MAGRDVDKSLVDVNFQRYCNCVFGVGQHEMCRVFLYLYQHHQPDPSVYVGDVLGPDGWHRAKTMGRAVLTERENPVNMDISLLYLLLQHTCGLEPDLPRGSVWNSPTTEAAAQSLEHHLYLLKELRNDLGHKPRAYMNLTKQQLEEKVGELERLCCEIVIKASNLTAHSPGTLVSIIINISVTLHDIITRGHPPNLHPQEWAMLAREEQQTAPHHHQQIIAERLLRLPQGSPLPTVGQQDILGQVLAWRCPDGSVPQLILVRGQAGVGKTSLCQDIWKSWVARDGVDEECDLVLQVQCGRVVTRDVARLVQEDLLPSSSRHCDPGQLLGFLASLRVLWLLDGLEEPAPEAIHLLGGIIEKFSNKHLVMVTCQPSYVKEVTSLAADRKVYEVTLVGLSDGGAHSMLKQMLHGEHYTKFVEDMINVHPEVQIELLRNPLKLILVVTLWQEGTLDIGAGDSLLHLYSEVEAAQLVKVSTRMARRWGLTTLEAKERIQVWLKQLYEVAFNMTAKNEFVLLNKTRTQLFKEKSCLLLHSYMDCFSTFLTCLPDTSLLEENYRFIHLTQQRYMAAQHLYHQLLSLPCPAAVLKQMLQLDHADEKYLDRFYDVLLLVFSSLVARGKLEESLEEILISTLNECEWCDWMEVLHCAGHSERVAEGISRYMPGSWVITDNQLCDATLLLKYATPSLISITIDNNPDNLTHLLPFIKQVAVSDSEVYLSFNCIMLPSVNISNDKYLKVLCDKEAKCTLTQFKGIITADAYTYFLQKPDIVILELFVSNMKTLHALMLTSNGVVSLHRLIIHFTMTNLNNFFNISIRKDIKLCINMPFMKDVHLKMVIKFLSRVSRRYETITLRQVSPEAALRFVKKLAAKRIEVGALHRIVAVNIYGATQIFDINCGIIPTVLSNNHFKSLWNNPKVELIVSGNNLRVSTTFSFLSSGLAA